MRFLAWLLWIVVFTLAADTIHLKTRDLNPQPDPQQYLAAPLKQRVWGRSHYLIQFAGGASADHIRTLRDRGALVTGYLPDATLMVTAGDSQAWDGVAVRWAGRLDPVDKISPALASAMAGAGRMVALIEFHPDVSPTDARNLAWEQNLTVIERPGLLPRHLLVFGWPFDIARLAEWDEMAYAFPASPALFAGNSVRACAGGLTTQGPVGQYVAVGTGWPSNGADGVTVQYVFAALTDKLPAALVQSEILRAFAEWSKVAKVSFVPGSDPNGPYTVQVLFASGSHGDPYPFDGPGGVLAHTYYPSPPNPEPIAGDMHLDADERWQVGANFDLYSVVLHEAGHALGFGHTDDPGSVMYPYYRFGIQLSASDIAGAQDLYGARDSAPTAPTPPSSPDPPPVPPSVPPGIPPSGPPTSPPASPPTSPPASPPATPPVSPPATPPSSPPTTPPASPPAAPPPGSPPDTTPPGLVITWPASTIVATSDQRITLQGTAMDDIGVVRVSWQSSTGAAGDALGTGAWSATIPLLQGNNTITVRAFDAAGNLGWRSLTVVRN